MTGKQHARLLGLFFWLFTAFNLLIVAVIAVLYISIFGFVFTQAPQRAGDPDPAVIMTILIAVFAFVLIFTVMFSIPKMVAGYGLRNEKTWARVWSIVACVMAVMSFPLGTALGVYGLIFLLGDEGKRYFESIEYGRLTSENPSLSTAPPPDSWR